MQTEIVKNLIVTGSNRGIGYALVRLMLEKALPHNIILTARDTEKFKEKFTKLQQTFPSAKLFLHQLDITQPESIKNFAKWFAETHKTLDILVNNSGVGLKEDIYATQIPTEDVTEHTIATNFYGLVSNTQAFLPYLSPKAKIVNVSSMWGNLERHDPKIKAKLLDSKLTTEDLLAIAQDYQNQVKNKKLDGWAVSAYAVSKSLVTAYTRFALKKELKEGQIAVAVHPGWCRTNIGGPDAILSAEDGAKKIYHMMFGIDDNKDAFQFFIDDKIYEEN